MIDFHSHILPGIDDGSRDLEESIRLLDASAEQSVDTIIATPHFYANRTSPDKFLRKRNEVAKYLFCSLKKEHPRILLGAEVYFFEGIHRSEAIKELRIADTPLLLLEMPFSKWSDHMIDEVLLFNEERDVRIVLAHIERSAKYQKKGVLEEMIRHGVLLQSNAEFFISRKTRRKALKMLNDGMIHFLGSDCHNSDSRPQNIGEAYELIGETGRRVIDRNAVLQGLTSV